MGVTSKRIYGTNDEPDIDELIKSMNMIMSDFERIPKRIHGTNDDELIKSMNMIMSDFERIPRQVMITGLIICFFFALLIGICLGIYFVMIKLFRVAIIVNKILMEVRKGTLFLHIVWELFDIGDAVKIHTIGPDFAIDHFEEIDEILHAIERITFVDNNSNGSAKQPTKEGKLLREHSKFKETFGFAEEHLIGVSNKTTAITSDDTTRPDEVDILTHDETEHAVCLKALEGQHTDIDITIAKTNRYQFPAPDKLNNPPPDMKAMNNTERLEPNYTESIQNTCILNVDIEQGYSDDNRAEERPDSRKGNFSDGVLYCEGLQKAGSRTVETKNNDESYTEETELKTVYDPVSDPISCLENTQNLGDSVLKTERTERISELPAEESYGKSRIITSAERSKLHELLRNFFEAKDNGIRPQELLNRTFGVPILVIEICRAPTNVSGDSEGRLSTDNLCSIFITSEDEACINSYFDSRGFRFHCRSGNCFYFGVGGRSWGDVSAEIGRMEGELRMLCFGRFFGRTVAGSRINSPRDLVLSFRNGGFEQSSWRFYCLLFDNNKPVLARLTFHMQRRKLTYIYCLFALMYYLICLNKEQVNL